MYLNSSFSKLQSRKAAQEINVRHLNTHDQYLIKSDGRSGRLPWAAVGNIEAIMFVIKKLFTTILIFGVINKSFCKLSNCTKIALNFFFQNKQFNM